MADDYDKQIAAPNFLNAGIDRKIRTRTEKLHRIVLKLQASNGVQNASTLLREVGEGATHENVYWLGHFHEYYCTRDRTPMPIFGPPNDRRLSGGEAPCACGQSGTPRTADCRSTRLRAA